MVLELPLSQQVVLEPSWFNGCFVVWFNIDDMFSTMIKLVGARWSLKEDYVWYKFATSVHKYDYDYGNNDDLIQGRFALNKVELFQKERRLLYDIWVKVEIVGKVSQISIMICLTTWVFLVCKIKLILGACAKKEYSLVYKESLFFVKELMHSLSTKE